MLISLSLTYGAVRSAKWLEECIELNVFGFELMWVLTHVSNLWVSVRRPRQDKGTPVCTTEEECIPNNGSCHDVRVVCKLRPGTLHCLSLFTTECGSSAVTDSVDVAIGGRHLCI